MWPTRLLECIAIDDLDALMAYRSFGAADDYEYFDHCDPGLSPTLAKDGLSHSLSLKRPKASKANPERTGQSGLVMASNLERARPACLGCAIFSN